ncbi:MAG TPA: FmdB family zinc ribbon protein [Actinomycetota bacterium]|nr:FmdB family zinc ribbon protein [Actinomycetota bacterium]
MPTYEYRCLNCENRTEVFQSFKDDPLTTCEVCGGPLRKVIHPVGIQFKGSGFYSTDRRASHPMRGNSKDKEKDKADKSSGSGPESKSDSKADSKPAAKPEPAPAAKKAEKSA